MGVVCYKNTIEINKMKKEKPKYESKNEVKKDFNHEIKTESKIGDISKVKNDLKNKTRIKIRTPK